MSLINKHCCRDMERATSLNCKQHRDVFECPDVLISYISKFDEFGLIIHDGGSSSVVIRFCPWCGSKLPLSKREIWFEKLEELGFDDPTEQKIPEAFESDAWYSNTYLAM
ncbi:hypothetical protein GCM10009092_11350 [Bowmanella denitrificans]|uniref:DUF6980 domain-containing protein n=1 Tax=Bowmanella denitrificans TaxID=366582 RepID=A0ABN0WXU8_9ALTE